jgi:hypothetical protein
LSKKGYSYFHAYAKYVCNWLATAMKVKMKHYVTRMAGLDHASGTRSSKGEHANNDLVPGNLSCSNTSSPAVDSPLSNSPCDVGGGVEATAPLVFVA